MPKHRQLGVASETSKRRIIGGGVLALMPIIALFYVMVVLAFIPNEGSRIENVIYWPALSTVVLALLLRNIKQVDTGFLRSAPILSLLVYYLFAAASISWAHSPDLAFSRYMSHVFVFVVVVLPFALPIGVSRTIPYLQMVYLGAIALSAVYVLTTPPTPIGHSGYFTHKQELGLLGATALVVFCYEFLFGGWRRMTAGIGIVLGIWVLLESESKSAFAFAWIAMILSFGILVACKFLRTSPAWIIGAVCFGSLFIENAFQRIAHRFYGDATLTGRTDIWAFIEYQISHKAWFGWGFHSYYMVPNSPHESAPGFVRDMPSSHSGFLELRLETGRIGYVIFLVFVYASLHYIERVRRIDPKRAWFYLSVLLFSFLINLLDSGFLGLNHLWLLHLLVVAESVRFSRSAAVSPGLTTRSAAVNSRARVPRRLAARPM